MLRVGSDWDAVPGLLPVGFPSPPSEPDVRVSAHPALHNLKPLVRSLSALGSPMVWGCERPGSGSGRP